MWLYQRPWLSALELPRRIKCPPWAPESVTQEKTCGSSAVSQKGTENDGEEEKACKFPITAGPFWGMEDPKKWIGKGVVLGKKNCIQILLEWQPAAPAICLLLPVSSEMRLCFSSGQENSPHREVTGLASDHQEVYPKSHVVLYNSSGLFHVAGTPRLRSMRACLHNRTHQAAGHRAPQGMAVVEMEAAVLC